MGRKVGKGNSKPPVVKDVNPVYVGDIFDDEIDNDQSKDVESKNQVSNGGRLSRGSSKRSVKDVKSSSTSESSQNNTIGSKKRIRRANQFYEDDLSIKSISGNEIGLCLVDVAQQGDGDGVEVNEGNDDDEEEEDDDDDDDDDDDNEEEDDGNVDEDEEGQLEFVANKDHDVKAAIVQSTKGTSKGVFYACSSFHFGLSSLYFFNRVISSLWWLIRTYLFSL